jgi:hypothetical protein
MTKSQSPLIATQLPFAGAPGRLRPNLAIARGERGKFFVFSTTKYQIVPRLEDLKKIRKLYSPLHLRSVFTPPRGRGAKIPAEVGQMKDFMSLETSDLRAPAGRAIRNNAPLEAATGGTFRMSTFPATTSGCTYLRGSHEGANFTKEANRREVAGFA